MIKNKKTAALKIATKKAGWLPAEIAKKYIKKQVAVITAMPRKEIGNLWIETFPAGSTKSRLSSCFFPAYYPRAYSAYDE